MKILVTGSLGIIGTPLVKALKAKGHTVFGIDLTHSSLPESEYMRCDIRSMYQLQEVFKQFQPDLVYHLAAEFGRNNGEDYYDTLWQTNAVGTKNILVLQREYKFRMIFASSSEAYGELPNDSIYTEDATKLLPLRHYNDYAITKWVNEQQIVNDMERFGTETMILRFFNAYGEGEIYHSYRSVVSLFVYRLLKNLPITVFKGYHRVFMHIDDLIKTLSNAPENFKVDVYNVGGADYMDVGDVVELIKKEIPETTSPIYFVDKEFMNVTNKLPDLSKARRDLGHNPEVTIKDGIKRTVEWARGYYTT